MRLSSLIIPLALTVAGCVEVTSPTPAPSSGGGGAAPASSMDSTALTSAPAGFQTVNANSRFAGVVRRVEPIAEAQCRQRTGGSNCDFAIYIDADPAEPANAYQTLDNAKRPVIVFTRALLADAQNTDELAFVLGHEAAHHIAGHIPKQQGTAVLGALILGTAAGLGGASAESIDTFTRLGAAVGGRFFSQDMELEADALGTVIAHDAGYDPVLGAQFFDRIPDPGETFLGSHPPNAKRQETVQKVAAGL